MPIVFPALFRVSKTHWNKCVVKLNINNISLYMHVKTYCMYCDVFICEHLTLKHTNDSTN